MAQKTGIDVSHHQGEINWHEVYGHIDFAMLRAGYGQNAIDNYFHKNARECTELGIPFGAYWFSYAYTVDMAKREAQYAIEACKKYNIQYPLAFDFEYDSYNYAFKKGVKVDADLMCAMAEAFLQEVEAAGYYAINYTNPDFLNRGFERLTGRYDTWLAHWGVKSPSVICGIWQHSSYGSIPGIKGYVDEDIAYKDYPAIINSMAPVDSETETPFDATKTEKIHTTFNKVYDKIADDIINGKYGNGEERIAKLKQAGYDHIYAQSLVNALLS